ncbi:hypothetical protein VNO77_39439 [Canavalia gladiata]|uniref:Uncharacterized protein n=1 Tax=Canavalia gladiata TaxID=3824 RepID=A0AAN9PX47_CANGL
MASLESLQTLDSINGVKVYPKLAIINNGSMGEEYNSSFQAFPFSAFIAKPYCDLAVFSMRKSSTLQCALLRFGVPLMLIVIFCVTSSAEVSGNEMNTQTEELTKTNLNEHDEDAKFKFFHPKPIFKKRIPIIKHEPKVTHPKFEKPHHPHFPLHPKFEKPHHPHFPIHPKFEKPNHPHLPIHNP